MMGGAVAFALLVLAYVGWRFGGPDVLSFAVISGLFAACMDFMSAFVAQNYEYPGQSRLWVFTFIFFGWIGMCGTCLFIAEGILVPPRKDMLSERRMWWQVPVLTGIIAVALDLFIDPMRSEIGKRAFREPAERARIVRASLGSDAGIAGAAYLAFDRSGRDRPS